MYIEGSLPLYMLYVSPEQIKQDWIHKIQEPIGDKWWMFSINVVMADYYYLAGHSLGN